MTGSKDDIKAVVEQFHKKQPFFYDEHGQFWIWKKTHYKQVITLDLFIIFNKVMKRDYRWMTSKSKEVEGALQQVGRVKQPREPSLDDICCGDLVVNFKTRVFRAPSSKQFHTNVHPYTPDWSNRSSVINKYLLDVCNQDEVKAYTLKEVLAYLFYRGCPIHKFFFLVGKSGTGKSTFLRFASDMLGSDNISVEKLVDLLSEKFATYSLYKKNAVLMSELPHMKVADADILKNISGGDEIKMEQKFKQSFKAKTYAKLLMAVNLLPLTSDTTSAFYRRVCVVVFDYCFPRGEDFEKSIAIKEKEYFMAELLDVLKDLLERKRFRYEPADFNESDRLAEEVYRSWSNPILAFLNDLYVEDTGDGDDGGILFSDFKRNYIRWCESNDRPFSSKYMIGRFCEQEDIDLEKVGGQYYRVRGWRLPRKGELDRSNDS